MAVRNARTSASFMLRDLAVGGFVVLVVVLVLVMGEGRPFLRWVSVPDYTIRMPSDMPGAPLFEALIVPHRSLSVAGQRWLMLAMAGLCGLIALRFWFLGAWPIIAFCGLEGVAAIVLIAVNSRRARGSELLMLSAGCLRVVRTTPSGKRSEVTLASPWLNVMLEEAHGRVPRLLLGLRAQWVEVGAVLGETEKRELAAALQAALYQARNPVFGNPEPDPESVMRPSDPSI